MARILLVEDDRLLAGLYLDAMAKAGLKAVSVNDAQSAIDKLDDFKFDLMLLDLMLPAHNGLEVIYELQSHNDLKNLPVILLSATKLDAQFLTARQLKQMSIVEYLYKPDVLPNQLVETVRRWLV
ncbi:MAG TPA: response regulator [Candidatus Saccharimonadales bacterium]